MLAPAWLVSAAQPNVRCFVITYVTAAVSDLNTGKILVVLSQSRLPSLSLFLRERERGGGGVNDPFFDWDV